MTISYEPHKLAKKVIVSGGRDFDNYPLLKERLDHYTRNFVDVVIVHGGQQERIGWLRWTGADFYARRWARERMKTQQIFYPNWKKFKKAAGMIRNREMAEYVGRKGYLIAFWDGKSPGTENMIEEASRVGMPAHHIKVVRY